MHHAVVHSSDRSKVIFTAEFPTLPPGGTVLSLGGHELDLKYVVVRAYIDVPVADKEFPFCRKAFIEVREISLDTDFPNEFPQ